MLNVAIISYWHVHAKDYTRMLLERPERAKITCIWDEDPVRGAEWASKTGADYEADYNQLLARADVDAVVIVTSTNLHEEAMVKAAKAGKHIFTEKVLAPTLQECDHIAAAVEENKVQFCISYPQMETPAFIYAKQTADSGKLGRLNLVRIRNGHDGATAGWLPEYWYEKEKACGGVMLDLGCHPMYLSRWILGKPVSVSSQFSYVTGRGVEDNAVCTVAYENGATAIVESSFVSAYSPYIMELYGDQGTLLIQGERVELTLKGEETAVIPQESLPARTPAAIDQWLDACEKGTPCAYNMEKATQLTELMQAAYLAAEEERTVLIDELE